MSHDTIINVYYNGEVITSIDSENPNLEVLVNSIISDEKIQAESLTCKSDIDNFDIKSFELVLNETVKQVRNALISEVGKYDEIRKTIKKDPDVFEYFNKLLSKEENL